MVIKRPKNFVVPTKEISLQAVTANQWVLAEKYSEAHRVARDEDIAVCGRPIATQYHEWVILAPDKWKRCARCDGRDPT